MKLSMKPSFKQSLLLLTASAALLSACGGDDSETPPAVPPPVVTNEVPASALVSVRAFFDYVGTLVARSETSVAVDINKATPPTSETESPQAI